MKKSILNCSLLLSICIPTAFSQAKPDAKIERIAGIIRAAKLEISKAECVPVSSGDEGRKITLNFDNTALLEVLNVISERCGFSFEFEDDLDKQLVNAHVRDATGRSAIDMILRPYGLALQGDNGRFSVVRMETFEKEGADFRYRSNARSIYQPLDTKFIKVENLKLEIGECDDECQKLREGSDSSCTGPPTTYTESSSKIMRSIQVLLSRQGAVEVDSRSSTFIITDTKERADLILGYISSLDKPEFTMDDIAKAVELENKK